jgi:hypothetical protein
VKAFDRNEPFHFARYGDGELYVLLRRQGGHPKFDRNVDHCKYVLPGLNEDLWRTVKKPKDYFYGLQPIAERKWQLIRFSQELGLSWVNSETMIDGAIDGKFNELAKVLNEYKLLFVGPAWLGGLPFKSKRVIPVPERDCYLAKSTIINKILRWIGGRDVVFFSAGYLSNILIYELHNLHKEKFLIDTGSLWGVFVNKSIRGWYEMVPDEHKQLIL